MDDCVRYTRPEVVDYGSLVELTADVDHLNLSVGVLRAVAGASVLSAPLVPGTPDDGGGVQTAQGTGSGTSTTPTDGGGGIPDDGGTLGDQAPGGETDAGAGAGTSGGGSGGGGTGGGGTGGDGRLPFTGFTVLVVAGVGAGFAAAGASLRARVRRDGPRTRF